jgi:DNA polymerase III epsilon subunit family exonuclease
MPISLVQKLRETPLAFVDVETTGASADFGHRVIEIGVCRLEGGRCVAEYQQLIDPQRKISPGVTAMTGISQAMVTGQPTFTDQFPCLLPLLHGAVVLGHNVRFDLGFLRKEFHRSGTTLTDSLGEHVPVLDTVRIARKRFGRGGNALQSLAPRLGYQPTVAHRALADAQTTAFVFEKLMEPVGGWDVCVCDAYKEQGGPMGLMPATPRESLLPLELEEALEQRCAVMMEYLDANQKRTHRKIEPLTIRRSGGELLMIAFCHMRNDRRTFKLDRIVQLSRIEPTPPVTTVVPLPPAAPPPLELFSPAPPASATVKEIPAPSGSIDEVPANVASQGAADSGAPQDRETCIPPVPLGN